MALLATDQRLPPMRNTVALTLALTMLAGACAGSPPASLDGREFVLVSLTAGGVEQSLVPGTQLRLSFSDGQLGAHAGCNHIGGSYSIQGARLLVGDLGMTEMGCDPDRHAQDDRVIRFLTSNPLIALDGDRLVLESPDLVAVLRDRRAVEPEPPLAGTSWMLTSIIEGDSASSVPAEVVSTIRFHEDGNVDVSPGCNSGGGRYELGEGIIVFGGIALTRMACPGARDQVEAAVLAVLAGEVQYEIDHGTLTLRAGDRGLQYRAG